MKHTQEEIINALQVIQNVCKGQQGIGPCENCPLSENGDCVLQNRSPDEWKIKQSPAVWKAFE